VSISQSELKIKDRDLLEAFELAASRTLSELGEDVRTAILFHISKIEGVKLEDTLKDPLQFAYALEKIFSAGSSILEDKIIETICRELGLARIDVGGTFEQKIAAVYESLYTRKASNTFYPRGQFSS
jgi:hypothetical protein